MKWLCYSNQNSRRQREYNISFTVLKRNQDQVFPTFLTSPTQHPVSQMPHLSQISFCSLVKGLTALTCSLESSLLAYSTRRKIHSFPSAVTPWTCFSLKAAASGVSPKTGRVFNVWSNLQRKTAMLLSEEPNGLLPLSKIIPTSKALSSQSPSHSLQPRLTVLNFQPTHVDRSVELIVLVAPSQLVLSRTLLISVVSHSMSHHVLCFPSMEVWQSSKNIHYQLYLP